jgi:hypothetical protein
MHFWYAICGMVGYGALKKIRINSHFLLPGKDFTPWVYALYRVNKRVLTRKIGQFRVTLRDITP